MSLHSTTLFNRTKRNNHETLHCSDAGFDCKAVVNANTEEEVLAIAAQHALAVHGVTVTPGMAQEIKRLIKDEEETTVN